MKDDWKSELFPNFYDFDMKRYLLANFTVIIPVALIVAKPVSTSS